MTLNGPCKNALIWQWGRFGSGPRYAHELSGALSRHCGYKTTLSLAEGAELMQSAVCRRAVDLPLHTYAGPTEFVWRSLSLQRVLRPVLQRISADPPDVAIVPMMGYWDIVLMRALRRMGVPVVSIVHDVEVHPGDTFHLLVQLQRRMLRMSQGVITLTNFVSRQLQSHISLHRKVHATIPHPAFAFSDLELPPPQLRQPSPERPLRLLMAGRLKRYKGLKLLAEAIKLVAQTQALSLRVVGSPSDPRYIELLRSLPRVELDLGWKTDREIIAHLDWADVAVLPYIEASQSGIAPLSFARARPVIATPVGGLPEQVRDGETGIVAESVSPAAFARAIQRFADDRTMISHYGENALRFAQTELGWETLARSYAEVLERVLTVACPKMQQIA
jgi:glycosyltransferase involved in cell wall biosynthesis